MTGLIILCADDYGLSPGVSHAIRMLAAANRISATSAIVTRPNWPREAAALKPLLSGIAVGLHLNLTLGASLTSGPLLAPLGQFPGLRRLILAAYSRRLQPADVTSEVERQLDAFEAGIGAAPDFVDGHEHVHVLPVVRKALLETLKRRYARRPLLIRNPAITQAQIFSRQAPQLKSLSLRFLSTSMQRDIEQHGFVSNDGFGGVTAFKATSAAVAQDFSAAAALEGWRPLVMCHPGFPDAELARIDRITARRQMEFDALMGSSPLAARVWWPVRASNGCIQWPHSPSEHRV
jgi:chitin disaccharide deacetylase